VVNASNTQKDWDCCRSSGKNSRKWTWKITPQVFAHDLPAGPLSKLVLESILQETGSRLPDPR